MKIYFYSVFVPVSMYKQSKKIRMRDKDTFNELKRNIMHKQHNFNIRQRTQGLNTQRKLIN